VGLDLGQPLMAHSYLPTLPFQPLHLPTSFLHSPTSFHLPLPQPIHAPPLRLLRTLLPLSARLFSPSNLHCPLTPSTFSPPLRLPFLNPIQANHPTSMNTTEANSAHHNAHGSISICSRTTKRSSKHSSNSACSSLSCRSRSTNCCSSCSILTCSSDSYSSMCSSAVRASAAPTTCTCCTCLDLQRSNLVWSQACACPWGRGPGAGRGAKLPHAYRVCLVGATGGAPQSLALLHCSNLSFVLKGRVPHKKRSCPLRSPISAFMCNPSRIRSSRSSSTAALLAVLTQQVIFLSTSQRSSSNTTAPLAPLSIRPFISSSSTTTTSTTTTLVFAFSNNQPSRSNRPDLNPHSTFPTDHTSTTSGALHPPP